MTVQIRLMSWQAARLQAGQIRQQVFVLEQHVPEALEYDAMDAVSIHALAFGMAGTPVGTGRLLPDGHIGRMAVLSSHRGSGVGGAILQALIDEAVRHHYPELVLHAQCHALGFYQRFGFRAEGGIFDEAGIPHRLMRRRLARRS